MHREVCLKAKNREIGHVNFSVWMYFFKAGGICFAAAAVMGMSSFVYIQIGANFLLGQWTDDVARRMSSPVIGNGNITFTSGRDKGSYKETDRNFISAYAGIMFFMLVCMLIGGYLMARLRIRVADRLHRNMLLQIARAPISFFDVTPTGRIMNRFSKETNQVDMMMTVFVGFAMVTLSLVIGALLAIGIATYGLFLILAIPIAFAYFKLYQLVSHTSIEVQRLEANFRSPLYAAFSEVLNGVETIRAFGQSRRFMTVHRDMLNRQMLPFFLARTCVGAWMVMRCNLLGGAIVLGIACIAVGFPIYSQQVW